MSPKLGYPVPGTVNLIDDYFGIKVADPYRWLEDMDSSETSAWIEAENRISAEYFQGIACREELREQVGAVYNYPKYFAPTSRGERIFFFKNDGLQNHAVLYVQAGLNGTPEAVLDPNTFSADGTTRLGCCGFSRDGHYLAYGISIGGSDWNELHVLEVQSKRPLPDVLQWVKFSAIAWAGSGFFYSRYPPLDRGRELTTKSEHHEVWFHYVGTPQASDELVYKDVPNPHRLHRIDVTDDERFAVLQISDRVKGKKGNALYYIDLSDPHREMKSIVPDVGDDAFDVVANTGGKLIIQTNRDAPRGKVVLWDPLAPERWADLIPEKSEPLESVVAGGGWLFTTYLKDVTSSAYIYSMDGKLEQNILLPGAGTVQFHARPSETHVFYAFSSFTVPTTIYRYDLATRASTVFRQPSIPGYHPSDYESKQVFFTSRDGTRIPMFLVHRRGLILDESNPALLTGYGGFNLILAPHFSSLRVVLLERGFVYAAANLRGGGEYGEGWHEAGIRLKKQNVVDDFIAAAEYLVDQKYTSSSRLAAIGTSNGGLLVAAAANRRPELFQVIVARSGVMDLLRFQHFTSGFDWIADYGSSENEAEFKVLYAYSPLHNIVRGTSYPATLVTTSDQDDRVVPAHSFKYVAALQGAQASDKPVVIRIDTNSGHGPSNTAKAISEAVDVYSFLIQNLAPTAAK
jgi:prolyl oligopeptidase